MRYGVPGNMAATLPLASLVVNSHEETPGPAIFPAGRKEVYRCRKMIQNNDSSRRPTGRQNKIREKILKMVWTAKGAEEQSVAQS